MLDERIKQRAYEIWESEGRPHGKDEEHWHLAAAEIRGETAVGGEAPTPRPARTRKTATKEGPAAPPKRPTRAKGEDAPAEKPAEKPTSGRRGKSAETSGTPTNGAVATKARRSRVPGVA